MSYNIKLNFCNVFAVTTSNMMMTVTKEFMWLSQKTMPVSAF